MFWSTMAQQIHFYTIKKKLFSLNRACETGYYLMCTVNIEN